MFIVSPLHADDDSITNIINRVSQTIEAEGGEITSVNHNPPWGRRRLAYPIRAYASGEASRRNFTEGFYVLMHFNLESAKVLTVDRAIRFIDPILRHLLTIITDTPTANSDSDDSGGKAWDSTPADLDGDDDDLDDDDDDLDDDDDDLDDDEDDDNGDGDDDPDDEDELSVAEHATAN
ncbi:MAG: 30S ribosomal protein S6 [Chloroflexaceae bacterium]|nr:30S ribosomal protein S6 [Chloroflexaceae bacterium]